MTAFNFGSPSSSARRRVAWRGAIAVAVLSCGALLGAPAGAQDAATRTSMDRVFEALRALVPVAFGESGEAWKTQAKVVQDSMATLTAESEGIAAHGAGRDASFRFLSESLATQARTLRWQVQRGDHESASYFTQRLVETCVACHVRLPATSDRDFARSLLQRVDPATLSPLMQAALLTAGRQFDRALTTYEKAFEDPDAPLESFEYGDAIASYLIVGLRVQRDPERVARTLQAFGRRADVSAQFRLALGVWQRALKELGSALKEPPSLDRAEQILEIGHAQSEFPYDSVDDVHTVLASSIAFRWLDAKRPEGQELARALYLLARTEAFTRRAFETSESSSYLEQAIRAAPRSAIAELAYARLELQTVLQYSGPFGVDLPEDVADWLRELRKLSGSKSKTWFSKPSDNRARLSRPRRTA